MHLRPLPARPYDTARLVYRLCDAEACIAWEGNHYEVPYEHAADFLPVRITGTQVFVYARDLRCIATHERLPKGQHGRARLSERRPPGHARGDSRELVRPVFADLGEEAAQFLRGLEQAHARTAAHRARKVLALRERYTTGDNGASSAGSASAAPSPEISANMTSPACGPRRRRSFDATPNPKTTP